MCNIHTVYKPTLPSASTHLTHTHTSASHFHNQTPHQHEYAVQSQDCLSCPRHLSPSRICGCTCREERGGGGWASTAMQALTSELCGRLRVLWRPLCGRSTSFFTSFSSLITLCPEASNLHLSLRSLNAIMSLSRLYSSIILYVPVALPLSTSSSDCQTKRTGVLPAIVLCKLPLFSIPQVLTLTMAN